MTDPNSPLARLRLRIAKKIKPSPDPGEGWCIGCDLNEGRTMVISATGTRDHAQLHKNQRGRDSYVCIEVTWPPVQPNRSV